MASDALQIARESLEEAKHRGPESQVEAHVALAEALISAGLHEEARHEAAVALTTAREIGNRHQEAMSLYVTFKACYEANPTDLDAAREAVEAALVLFQTSGNEEGCMVSWLGLARLHSCIRSYGDAVEAGCKALDLAQKLKDRLAEACTLQLLVLAQLNLKSSKGAGKGLSSSKPPKCRPAASESVAIFRALGQRVNLASTLVTLARACLQDGAAEKARAAVSEALAILEEDAPQDEHGKGLQQEAQQLLEQTQLGSEKALEGKKSPVVPFARKAFPWRASQDNVKPETITGGIGPCERCGFPADDADGAARALSEQDGGWYCKACWTARVAGVQMKVAPQGMPRRKSKTWTRQELETASLIELYKSARGRGIDFHDLAEAMEMSDPKFGLVELLLSTN